MLKKLDDILSAIENVLIVSLTLVGLGLATAQVVLRYAFNTGIHWLEAGLVTALVWAMLMGAVRAVREGIHPRVDLIPMLAGPKTRVVLNIVGMVALLSLIGFYLADSIFYGSFVNKINALHPELGIPMIYPFLIIPIVMALMLLRYAMIAYALWFTPDAEAPDQAFRTLIGDTKQAMKAE